MTRVWMKVSRDKYELPVAVANSARELGIICGVNEHTIYASMSHAKRGDISHTPYVCVIIDEEDDNA